MKETELLESLKQFVSDNGKGINLDIKKFYENFIELYLKPGCQGFTTNFPSFIITDLQSLDKKACYDPTSNTIAVNRMNLINMMNFLKSGHVSKEDAPYVMLKHIVEDFFYIIHEWRHFLQEELKRYVENKGSFKNPIFDFNDTKKIVNYLKKNVPLEVYEGGEAVKKELEFITKSEYGKIHVSRGVVTDLQQVAEEISIIKYWKRVTEQDAREDSIDVFAKLIQYFNSHQLMQDVAGKRVISVFESVHDKELELERDRQSNYDIVEIFDKWFKNIKSEDFKNYTTEIQNLITELQLSVNIDMDKVAQVTYRKSVLEQVLKSYVDKVLMEMKESNKIKFLRNIYDFMLVDGESWGVEILRNYVQEKFGITQETQYFDLNNTEFIFEELIKKNAPINSRTFDNIEFEKTFPIESFIEKGQTRYAEKMVLKVCEREDRDERLAQTLLSVKDRVEVLQENFKNNTLIFDDVYDLLILMDRIRLFYEMPILREYYFDVESPEIVEGENILETMYQSIVIDLEKISYDYASKKRKESGLPMHGVDYFRFGSFEDKKQYLLSGKAEKDRVLEIYGPYEYQIDYTEEKIYNSVRQKQ